MVTKSPLTGFIADSLSSSYFALELKRVGIDALVITGRAAGMTYIFIHNDKVELRSADHLRGKSPVECESLIRAELGTATARVAAIGKAGENMVRFATISNEGRHAGRGGVGAVMGSKNLKAVVLRGDHATDSRRSGRASRQSPKRCASAVWARLPTSIERSAPSPIWQFLTASELCRRAIFSNPLLINADSPERRNLDGK